MAQQHAHAYERHQLRPETQAYFDEIAVQSLQQQQQLEQAQGLSFADYVAQFR